MYVPRGPADGPMDLAYLVEDNGPRTLAVCWSLTVVAAGFIALRFYAKTLHGGGRLWYDDMIVLGSWLALLINVAVVTSLVPSGYGKHSSPAAPADVPRLALVGNVSATFAVVAICWSKTSFAVTLLRTVDGWAQRFVWLVIISLNVLLCWAAMVHWIYCSPLEKAWKPLLGGTCWSLKVVVDLDLFTTAYSAAMDFTLALFPWYLIRHMEGLQRREKAGIALAIVIGVCAGATAIAKCVYLPTSLDMDISSPNLAIWSTTEAACSIVAASIPGLRALVREKKKGSAKERVDGYGDGDDASTSAEAGGPEATMARSTSPRGKREVDEIILHIVEEWEHVAPERPTRGHERLDKTALRTIGVSGWA